MYAGIGVGVLVLGYLGYKFMKNKILCKRKI